MYVYILPQSHGSHLWEQGYKPKRFGHDECFGCCYELLNNLSFVLMTYASKAYFSIVYKILLPLSPDFSPNNTCERVTAANLGNCSAVCISQANYSTEAIEICVST